MNLNLLFKKRLLLILTGLLLPLAAQNLVMNEDFENGETDWTIHRWRDVDYGHTPGEGRTKTDAVKLASLTEQNDCFWSQDVVLVAGKQYILKGYIKTENVTAGFGAHLSFFGAGFVAESAALHKTKGWTYLSTVFTADGPGQIRLRFGNIGTPLRVRQGVLV